MTRMIKIKPLLRVERTMVMLKCTEIVSYCYFKRSQRETEYVKHSANILNKAGFVVMTLAVGEYLCYGDALIFDGGSLGGASIWAGLR